MCSKSFFSVVNLYLIFFSSVCSHHLFHLRLALPLVSLSVWFRSLSVMEKEQRIESNCGFFGARDQTEEGWGEGGCMRSQRNVFFLLVAAILYLYGRDQCALPCRLGLFVCESWERMARIFISSVWDYVHYQDEYLWLLWLCYSLCYGQKIYHLQKSYEKKITTQLFSPVKCLWINRLSHCPIKILIKTNSLVVLFQLHET